jgi:hypothetical protein
MLIERKEETANFPLFEILRNRKVLELTYRSGGMVPEHKRKACRPKGESGAKKKKAATKGAATADRNEQPPTLFENCC